MLAASHSAALQSKRKAQSIPHTEEKLVFHRDKEGGAVPAPEVQIDSDTFSYRDEVLHMQFLPPPPALRCWGRKKGTKEGSKEGRAERILYIHIRHFDEVNSSVSVPCTKEVIKCIDMLEMNFLKVGGLGF